MTANDYAKLNVLFDCLEDCLVKHKMLLPRCFDGIGKSIIMRIYDKDGSENISQAWLARMLKTTRQRIRTRLPDLARYGILLVVYDFGPNGLKTTSNIKLNDVILGYLKDNVKLAQIKSYAIYLTNMYIARLEKYDDDMQGFEHDCKFGDPEPKEGMRSSAHDKLINALDQIDNKKTDLLRERLLWKERSDIVVAGAASLWIWAQEQLGMGSASPNWVGDINTMGQSAKAQRNEIVKTFLHYGGRVTSLAWYVFVGGIPELDEKTGLPIFTLAEPHRQYVTIDRKPSQFAKHFNAILKDHVFIKLATEGWAVFYPKLKDHFKGTIDVGPKSGDSDELLAGITFGPLNSND